MYTEKEVTEDLGKELLELSKDYLRSRCIDYEELKKRFKDATLEYNELLKSDITEEFLRKKGLRIQKSERSF